MTQKNSVLLTGSTGFLGKQLRRLLHKNNIKTILILRKKIEKDSKNPRYLQTLRGKGYMLLAD